MTGFFVGFFVGLALSLEMVAHVPALLTHTNAALRARPSGRITVTQRYGGRDFSH